MITFVLFMALHGGGIGPAVFMGASPAYWLRTPSACQSIKHR